MEEFYEKLFGSYYAKPVSGNLKIVIGKESEKDSKPVKDVVFTPETSYYK